MPASEAQRKATAARRERALALRDAGAEWQQIADALGYASRSAACKDVARALADRAGRDAMSADALREQEIRRLDRIQRGLWTDAVGGDRDAADVVLRIIEQRRRLQTPGAAVVAVDDRRRSLRSIRDYVAAELNRAEGRDVAVLAKALADLIRELDSLPAEGRETPLDRIAGAIDDDLAARRATRRAAAAGP